MSIKEGQAATQPSEGAPTLTDIAAMMDGSEEGGEDSPDESADGEDAEESEEVEAEEEQEADDAGEEDAEEPTFTIKHDGKEVALKQSELVDMAQQGFDYTKKTMALAQDRKVVEAAHTQANELRQRHEQALTEQLSRLEALERFYGEQVGSPPPIEWAQQDAAYYLAQKELYETRRGQLEQAKSAIGEIREYQHRQRQEWIAKLANETDQALRDTLPGWSDEKLAEYAKYAAGLGLTPDKAEFIPLQKGYWELIHKAKAYDELQAKKAEMKPVAKLAKVSEPGTTNQPPQLARRQEAFKRHRANPTLASLVDLL